MRRDGLPGQVLSISSIIEDAADRNEHDARNGIQSKHYLTMLHPRDTDWIVQRVRSRIEGRTVVEIGAGVGVLACELARYAKRVFAIEADLAWSWIFARQLYQLKPANLTWIVDSAANLVDVLHADVAIVVTGSDADGLRTLAQRFAPEVILPWQDWNGGKPIVRDRLPQPPVCSCLYGCVLDGAHGSPLAPGVHCDLRARGVAPSSSLREEIEKRLVVDSEA